MKLSPSVFALLLVVLAEAGCTGGHVQRSDSSRRFTSEISHIYFPLNRGVLRTYEGHRDGVSLREEVRTLDATRAILGVACTAVAQEVYLDSQLTEVTTEWYAQDSDGNVWKFGEESLVLGADGVFVGDGDSWVAGVAEAQPWIEFPAAPRPGDRYDAVSASGVETRLVVSTTATVTVASGAYTDCLVVEESPDDPADKDIILYAPRVGRVLGVGMDERSELVTLRRD
jgi:hypothetical protein